MHKGEKAGKAWISAVAQNFAVGLAEARDFSDALHRVLPDAGALPTGGVRPQRRRIDAGPRDRRVGAVSRLAATSLRRRIFSSSMGALLTGAYSSPKFQL